MEFIETELKGAYCIKSFYAGDKRGSFIKSFEKEIYRKAGIQFSVQEVFYTLSAKNVIRGFHFQKHNPQAKLVSVVTGKVWDVIIDLRPGSATYKKWSSLELSPDNHMSCYIPKGFAHGFLSMEDNTTMLYLCDGAYDKNTDGGIKIDDKELDVRWPINFSEALISERDLQLEDFKTYERSPMEL